MELTIFKDKKKAKLGILLFLFFIAVQSQQMLTPYDHVPSVYTMDKPSYSENYPDWAKMLYQYPINFNDIDDRYEAYILRSPKKKSPIVRYYKNWRRAIEPFAQSDGTIKLPDFQALYEEDKRALLKQSSSKKSLLDDSSEWTFLGPKETVWRNTESSSKAGKKAPWQANVYSLDVSVSNTNIIFCGTETGFINKSTDNGLTWKLCAPDYKFGGGILAVAIDPADSDVVYVSANSRLHKTTDGGISWEIKGAFKASRLRIDPNNSNKIIAATTTGIYISKDKGSTWIREYDIETWDIEVKPDDSNIIYAISSSKGDDFNLVISTDGGLNFSPDSNFPIHKNKSGGLLAVTPDNPDIVYLSILSEVTSPVAGNLPYIYKGTRSGGIMNWVLTKTGYLRSDGNLHGGEFSNGQGFFDFVLDVSPTDENTVFWGTTSFFKSTDGGVNFDKIGGYGGSFGIHPDMQDIKMLPDGVIWVSTDGGINYSSDYFTNQVNYSARITGLLGSDMWGFDQGWNYDVIVGGRYHNGNTALSDTYNGQSLRMGGGEAPTGWIVHGKPYQASFKDINSGYTTSIPKTIDEIVENRKYTFSKMPNAQSGHGKRRSDILEHPNFSQVLFTGEGTGFWKSSDMGESWDLLYSFPGQVWFVAISHKNPDVLYADVEGSGLFKSEDGGNTWINKSAGFVPSLGTADWYGYLHFVISPYDENTIYLSPNKRKNEWDGKILKSTDGGDNWINWSGTIPTSTYTQFLAIQPTNSGKDLVYMFSSAENNYTTAKGEVFYRKDGMGDWDTFSNNMDYPVNTKPIFAKPFYRDSKIRVAGNNGVWESPLAEPNFNPPYITPWVGKPVYECSTETIYLEDHSLMDHQGVAWEWSIVPAPQYISNPNIRNPEVILGAVGNYNITLKVTKNGQEYTSQTISIEAKECVIPGGPCEDIQSLVRFNFENNLNNEGTETKADLELDNRGSTGISYATGKYGDAYDFDGLNFLTTNPTTGWTGKGVLGDNHRTVMAWVRVTDLSTNRTIIQIGPKSDGKKWALNLRSDNKLRIGIGGGGFNSTGTVSLNTWTHIAVVMSGGTLADVVMYIDGIEAGTSTDSSIINTTAAPVLIGVQTGKQDKAVFPFVGQIDDIRIYDCILSKEQIETVMGGGTLDIVEYNNQNKTIKVFPVPTSGDLNISIPGSGNLKYQIYSSLGQLVDKGIIKNAYSSHTFDLSNLKEGLYYIQMVDEVGGVWNVKAIKK